MKAPRQILVCNTCSTNFDTSESFRCPQCFPLEGPAEPVSDESPIPQESDDQVTSEGLINLVRGATERAARLEIERNDLIGIATGLVQSIKNLTEYLARSDTRFAGPK